MEHHYVIEYPYVMDINDNEYKKIYTKNDVIVHVDYHINTRSIKSITYTNKNGITCRTDGPACIFFYDSGKIKEIVYVEDDHQHRFDGPSYIEYYEDGQIKIEEYTLFDFMNRNDDPAFIQYYQSGLVQKCIFESSTQKWDINTPNMLEWTENGVCTSAFYYNQFGDPNYPEDKIFFPIENYPRSNYFPPQFID